MIQAQRKKENPYLAHRQPSQAPAYVPGVTSTASAGISGLSSVLPMPAVDPVDESKVNEVIDDRLVGVIASRDRRGKKALHFAEAGTFGFTVRYTHLLLKVNPIFNIALFYRKL